MGAREHLEGFPPGLREELALSAQAEERAADESRRARHYDSTEGRLERIEEKLDRILEKLGDSA